MFPDDSQYQMELSELIRVHSGMRNKNKLNDFLYFHDYKGYLCVLYKTEYATGNLYFIHIHERVSEMEFTVNLQRTPITSVRGLHSFILWRRAFKYIDTICEA